MKIGFVILCYKNPEMVFECVNSLKTIRGIENSEIILVDNFSPDGTGQILESKYQNECNITVFLNRENAGYAIGNNIGYKIAKDKDCETIIILNSDVRIHDCDFISKLNILIHSDSEPAVIAPDIINLDYKHANPLKRGYVTKKDARLSLFKSKIANILLRLKIDYHKYKMKNSKTIENQEDILLEQFVPHGACIIFTPTWVKKESYAFCDLTFLFYEECFLERYCNKKKYYIKLERSLTVEHLEDGSIDSMHFSNFQKEIFVNTNQINSCRKYIKFLKDPIKYWHNEHND